MEYIYTKRKEKKHFCWLLRTAEDVLFCIQSVKFSKKNWLMVYVDYQMFATILERYDLWQLCDLINPNALKRTVISYIWKIAIDRKYCKNLPLLNN